MEDSRAEENYEGTLPSLAAASVPRPRIGSQSLLSWLFCCIAARWLNVWTSRRGKCMFYYILCFKKGPKAMQRRSRHRGTCDFVFCEFEKELYRVCALSPLKFGADGIYCCQSAYRYCRRWFSKRTFIGKVRRQGVLRFARQSASRR